MIIECISNGLIQSKCLSYRREGEAVVIDCGQAGTGFFKPQKETERS